MNIELPLILDESTSENEDKAPTTSVKPGNSDGNIFFATLYRILSVLYPVNRILVFYM